MSLDDSDEQIRITERCDKRKKSFKYRVINILIKVGKS